MARRPISIAISVVLLAFWGLGIARVAHERLAHAVPPFALGLAHAHEHGAHHHGPCHEGQAQEHGAPAKPRPHSPGTPVEDCPLCVMLASAAGTLPAGIEPQPQPEPVCGTVTDIVEVVVWREGTQPRSTRAPPSA